MSIEIGKTYVRVDVQGFSGRHLVVDKTDTGCGGLNLTIKSEEGRFFEIDYELTTELDDEE